MFVENELQNDTYRGYNPAFVKRARERASARRAEKMRLEAEVKARAELEAAIQKAEAARRNLAQIASPAKPIDMERLAALRELMNTPPDDGNRISVAQIISEEAELHGVSVRDILGASRNRRITDARHFAMYRARIERADMSLPHIGKVFRRDHTSVLHAIRRMEALIDRVGGKARKVV